MSVKVGTGEYVFSVDENWAQVPDGWNAPMAAVATDSHDRVYGFNRGDRAVIIFDRNGNYVDHWEGMQFPFPHAIYIDHNDNVWIVDRDDGQVMKFTTEGQLLLTIGRKGYRSDTGADNSILSGEGYKSVSHGGDPFNLPAGVVVAPSGEIYVADGYANCRVHRFSSKGHHISSWGTPGSDAGQFMLPHGIWIDKKGEVLVADRENNRIQAFTQDGEYVSVWADDLLGPATIWGNEDGTIYVAEHNGGYFSVFSPEGERLARWGGKQYRSCHGVAGNPYGDIYFVQPIKDGQGRRIVKYSQI